MATLKPKRGILSIPVLLFGVLCLALPSRATAQPFAYISELVQRQRLSD